MKITKSDVHKVYAVYKWKEIYKMWNFKEVQRLTQLPLEKIKLIYSCLPIFVYLTETNNLKKKYIKMVVKRNELFEEIKNRKRNEVRINA